jgi:hypothetical protein
MRIRSAHTNRSWLSPKPRPASETEGKNAADEAKELTQRALSELLRCQNLIVLSGLGTSLCVVNEAATPPSRKAPTMPDLWKRVRAAYDPLGDGSWQELLASVRHANNENIEDLLSECKVAEAFFQGEELTKLQAFIGLAESEIRTAVDFLDESDALLVHSAFLRRIARRSSARARAKIFTTNYDLCFERAAKDGRFVVVDGFSPTQPPTFDPVYYTYDIVRRGHESSTSSFIPNVFHLYKLHGSINWERCGDEIEKRHGSKKPILIYPRSSKYEQAFSQPYLEMISALQSALREPNTGLLIVGFGFNDNHISEPVLSAIRSNLGLKVVIVDPAFVKITDGHKHVAGGGSRDELNAQGDFEEPGSVDGNAYLKRIMQLIDQGDARLTLLCGTFEDVTREMPDLMAETDLERHMARMHVTGEGD